MQAKNHRKRTIEETLIHAAVVYTLPIYFVGGLYITGALLGWLVLAIMILRKYYEDKPTQPSGSYIQMLWVTGVMVMLLSLFISHQQLSLGLTQTIKSFIGWMKGWALIPIFIYIGRHVPLQHDDFVRSISLLAIQCLIFAAVSVMTYIAGANGYLYTSPLAFIGGAGNSFFEVNLFGMNPETGKGRWPFFAPWAPAAGFIACLFFIFCLSEKNRTFRLFAICGCLVMALLCQSRVGWVIFATLLPCYLVINKFTNPFILAMVGLSLAAIMLYLEPIIMFSTSLIDSIVQLRPDSTFVRKTLAEISLQRWQDEAPIWGHGNVERGPAIVENMMIGSHHTWYGLLFVKGIVGFICLAIPLIFTTLTVLMRAQICERARTAFCLCYVVIFYSFFENIEILMYLIWPAFLWIGMAIGKEERDAQKAST